MKLKTLATAAALAVAGVPVWAGGGNFGVLPPSASFSNTVTGAFTDTWTFNLGQTSAVAASLTNVEVTFAGFGTSGGILGFAATLNGIPLVGPTSTVNVPPITVTTKVLAGGGVFPAGSMYTLVVTGTGITGPSASYGGSITAVPVPEPETYAMMLAGLGVVGFLAARRRKVS